MTVIPQPLGVGAWCFLCLTAALAMLTLVQFLMQARREVVVILLSLRRGEIRGRYGSWQPYII